MDMIEIIDKSKNTTLIDPKHILILSVSFFGAIANYCDKYLRGEVLSVGRIVATIFLATYCGYAIAEVVIVIKPEWALASCGLGAVLGMKSIDFIVEVIKKRYT